MRHVWICHGAFLASLALISCSDGTGPVRYEIEVTPATVELAQGASQQLEVNVFDLQGALVTGVSVTFESSDPDIVEVSRSGLVSSVGPAGATAVVVRAGASRVSVAVTVTQVTGGIIVNPTTITMQQHQSRQIDAQVVDVTGAPIPGAVPNIEIFDLELITIEDNSIVRSRGPAGQTIIRISAAGFVATVTVTVTPVPTSIAVDPPAVVLGQGRSRQLHPTLKDAVGGTIQGQTFSYQSSAPSIVVVNASGIVQSVGPVGEATITVRGGSLSVTVPVSVIVISGIQGQIAARVPVTGSAYGAAVSATGKVYVTTLFSGLNTAQLPSFDVDRVLAEGGAQAVAFNSTGTFAFISGGSSAPFTKIDVATNTVAGTLATVPDTPIDVLVAHDDQTVYLSTGDGSVLFIDPTTLAVRTTARPAGTLVHLALHPTLPRLYASEPSGGRVHELDATTGQTLRSFITPAAPQKVIVSADGTRLYVATESGTIQAWDLPSGSIAGSSTLGCGAWGMAMTPDGQWLFASCSLDGKIVRIERATLSPIETITTTGFPRRMAVSPDGSTLVVANEQGWVDFIQ
jgi:hypothetical protein